jgi:hypothetical protein
MNCVTKTMNGRWRIVQALLEAEDNDPPEKVRLTEIDKFLEIE